MFELQDTESATGMADWIELELAAGEPSLSKAKVSSIINAVGGDEPTEAFLSSVWRNLEERQERYSKELFECHGDIVDRIVGKPAPPEYVACLLFSLYGVADEHRTDPKIFERLAAEAIKNYVQGKVFVFGWPVLPDVQADIRLRVQGLAIEARENFAENPGAQYKDRGVDVVAWKPFEEHSGGKHRSGQLVILVQCAAGANWKGKTGQLPYRSWIQYIHWACDPLTGFAVPRIIPREQWHDISRDAQGILFDRIRIVNSLPNGIQDGGLRAEIEAWVTQEIEDARV